MVFYSGLLCIMLCMVLIRHLSPIWLGFRNKVELTEILAVLLLMVLAAAREGIGTDYVNYATYYGYYQKGINPEWLHFEPLFVAMIHGLIRLGCEYQMLFALVSVLTLGLVYIAYQRSSEDIILSLFLFVSLYFYFNSMNVMRQYLAMAIVLCSYEDIREKRLWRFLLLCGIACMFHTSAIVFVPAYFIVNWKIRYQWYAFMVALALGMRFLFPIIMRVVVHFLPQYEVYLNFESGGSTINMLVLGLILVLLLLLRNMERTGREHPEKMQDLTIHINLTFWGLCFMTFSSFNTLFSRVGSYYFLFSTMSLPLAVRLAPAGKKKLLAIVILALASVICLIYLRKNISGVVPYAWCLS